VWWEPTKSDKVEGMSLALALLFVTAPPKFALTVENIMRGPELVGHAPSRPQYSLDGKTLFFRWQKAGQDQPKLYAVESNGTNLREATRAEQQKALAVDGDLTPDRSKFTYEIDGDLYWCDDGHASLNENCGAGE
jgi:hypothetical protein